MNRKKRNKTFRAFSKILKNDRDYDYAYMLFIERRKLQLMAPYYEEHQDYAVSKDLRLCIRLLDIALEEDAEYKAWQKESGNDYYIPEKSEGIMDWLDAPTQWKRQPTSFPTYINARNASRFLSSPDFPLTELDGTYDALSSYIRDLTRVRSFKALHLYHLIRMYHMTRWWY